MSLRAIAVLLVAVMASSVLATSVPYKLHSKINILANTVGSLYNPAEVFPYYSLPFCAPKETTAHGGGLGDAFAGNRKQSSLYDIRYMVDIQWQSLCSFRLTQDDIKLFIDAIKRDYVFELFVDDLPVQGMIGEVEHQMRRVDSHLHNDTHFYLFTHLDFTIAYNSNRVIAINVTTDPQQRLKLAYGENLNVEFSYSAHWVPTTVRYANRMDLHSKGRVLYHESALEVHWLSVINSFVLVLLLTVFLASILMKVLKNDVARYVDVDDEDLSLDGGDRSASGADADSGWKMVRADVFRVPQHVMLLASAVGTGFQLLVILFCCLILAIFGMFVPGHRSALYTAAIMLYSITSFISGYVSAYLYAGWGGDKWATNAVLTASLFTGPFFAMFAYINSVARFHQSSTALPITTVLMIVLLWALVTFPLTVFGAMKGRQAGNSKYDPPCKPNRVAREIPAIPLYRTGGVQVAMAGLLPFSAIYIELHYLFAAVWGHHVFTVFEILAVALLLLMIVTAFVTIALTYFQLSIEDYHWWWRSFLSGGSIGFFIFAYGAFFYVYRSAMSGFLQASFFFGYMIMIAYGSFLMLGAVGFFSSYKFVWHIYHSIKSD